MAPTAPGPNDLEAAALVVEPRLAAWRDRFGDATGKIPCWRAAGHLVCRGAYPGDGRVVAGVRRS